MKFSGEVREHFEKKLIPFWLGMKDEKHGGYYGYMDYGLHIDPCYEKGCILNSRILWFFSNAYLLLGDEELKKAADHAWYFMKDHCIDPLYGGIYWSVTCDGQIHDDTKHTYNQAFAIYALSSYYKAVKNDEALKLAFELQRVIEERCTDDLGYQEAFDRRFQPVSNEKLSENGVMAEKTMNTLLHVFEAYTELYHVSHDEATAKCLRAMLDTIAEKVYNPALGRQEVFFDKNWHTLIDLSSFGHDIETAWLVDRGLDVLNDAGYRQKLAPITDTLTRNVFKRAFRGGSLMNESERGVPDTTRVWWVQAEAVVGFVNAWQKNPAETKWLEAAGQVWDYIKAYLIDKRKGSEWFWAVDEYGQPMEKPIVEPWKCPYHNGRMCIEIIRRLGCDT